MGKSPHPSRRHPISRQAGAMTSVAPVSRPTSDGSALRRCQPQPRSSLTSEPWGIFSSRSRCLMGSKTSHLLGVSTAPRSRRHSRISDRLQACGVGGNVAAGLMMADSRFRLLCSLYRSACAAERAEMHAWAADTGRRARPPCGLPSLLAAGARSRRRNSHPGGPNGYVRLSSTFFRLESIGVNGT